MGSATGWPRGRVGPCSKLDVTRAASACRPEPSRTQVDATPLEPAQAGPQVLWRVRDQATFARLRSSGRRVRSGPLWVAWVPADVPQPPRLAFAIGRRVGNAVVRNRLRRQLRAACQLSRPRPGVYLVGAAPDAARLSFDELKALVSQALDSVSRSRTDSR